MKKKIIASILVIAMVLAAFGTMPAKAANGPSNEYAFISFDSPTDYKEIYKVGTINNEAMDGVTYDLATNTLTLNNVNTKLWLSCNQMGDDFKVKLVGDNFIPGIEIYGDNHGGNLTITGDGTLTIDTDTFGMTIPEGSDEEMNGIVFYSEGTNPVFTVESTATVSIHAYSTVVKIEGTGNSNGTSAIVLKNGQDVSSSIKTKNNSYKRPARAALITFNAENDVYEQKYELFTKGGITYGAMQVSEEAYDLRLAPILYSAALERYFFDPTYDSIENDYNIIYDTKADLLAVGYVEVGQEVTIKGWGDADDWFNTATDNLGNVVGYESYYYNDDYEEHVYDIMDEVFTLSDGVEYHTAKENLENEAKIADGTYSVEQNMETVETGLFDVIIDTHTLTISPNGGEDPIEEPEKPEEPVINENLKVEASDNDEETLAAKDEVLNVLNDIVNAEEGTVSGVDEELAAKIREKVNAGETIYVEVVTTPVEADDIEDEAKAIEEGVTEGKVVSYYDVTIVLSTADEELGTVTQLKKEIEITLDIPDNLPAVADGYTRIFKGYRYHDGKLEEVETSVEGTKAKLKTNAFSTYALAYEDVKNDATNSNNPKTGDVIGTYFTMLTLSVLGFAAMAIIRKK